MIHIYYHVLTAFFVYALLFCGEWLLQPKLDRREPHLLKHKVPLLGHFIGLVRKGPEYYTAVARKNRPACFTLHIFGTRTYVVNTSQIIHSIQRNAKTLSFAPLIPYVAERIAGLRPELCKTWFQDNGRYNEGMGAEHARLIHHTLYTPDGARQMSHDVLAELKPLMDDIRSWGPTFGIYKWVIHVVSQTSFRAVYGPDHPLNDAEIEKAFWAFENNAGSLLTSIWPKIQAPTAYHGRQKLAAAFLQYYKAGNSGASTFVTMRRKLFEEHGFRVEDMAQFEAGMSTPILSNTAPALFWLLREIYSRPRFLYTVRKEIARTVQRKEQEQECERGHAQTFFTLNVARLKKDCPLLLGTYHEVLRQHGIGTSARRVIEDTVLDDQYLVKKNTLVLMPFAPVHAEEKWWGKNPQDFDATRFVSVRAGDDADADVGTDDDVLKAGPSPGPGPGPSGLREPISRPAHSFRSFGGAPHLCPGRQIATLEILCIAAMLIARYDVEPVLGQWSYPKLTYTMSGIATPSTDIQVSMIPLAGTEGDWDYEMGPHHLKFSLACN